MYINEHANACMVLHAMVQVSVCIRACSLAWACIRNMHVCAWYMSVRATAQKSMDPTPWHSPTEHRTKDVGPSINPYNHPPIFSRTN